MSDFTKDEEIMMEKLNASSINNGIIDIPFGATIGFVTISGIFHLKNPAENSSVDGVVVGAVNGTFNVDKNRTHVNLYGPFTKLEVEVDFQAKELRARLCKQKFFPDGWTCDGWNRLLSW